VSTDFVCLPDGDLPDNYLFAGKIQGPPGWVQVATTIVVGDLDAVHLSPEQVRELRDFLTDQLGERP
jgi:hypothetical protein